MSERIRIREVIPVDEFSVDDRREWSNHDTGHIRQITSVDQVPENVKTQIVREYAQSLAAENQRLKDELVTVREMLKLATSTLADVTKGGVRPGGKTIVTEAMHQKWLTDAVQKPGAIAETHTPAPTNGIENWSRWTKAQRDAHLATVKARF